MCLMMVRAGGAQCITSIIPIYFNLAAAAAGVGAGGDGGGGTWCSLTRSRTPPTVCQTGCCGCAHKIHTNCQRRLIWLLCAVLSVLILFHSSRAERASAQPD